MYETQPERNTPRENTGSGEFPFITCLRQNLDYMYYAFSNDNYLLKTVSFHILQKQMQPLSTTEHKIRYDNSSER